jgi:hypothetical protein
MYDYKAFHAEWEKPANSRKAAATTDRRLGIELNTTLIYNFRRCAERGISTLWLPTLYLTAGLKQLLF